MSTVLAEVDNPNFVTAKESAHTNEKERYQMELSPNVTESPPNAQSQNCVGSR